LSWERLSTDTSAAGKLLTSCLKTADTDRSKILYSFRRYLRGNRALMHCLHGCLGVGHSCS
jgi:hypothetical protein